MRDGDRASQPGFVERKYVALAKRLYEDHMRWLGSRRTMALSKLVNRWKYGRHQRLREALYRDRFAELLAERPQDGPRIQLEDGFAIDTSGKLPFVQEALEAARRPIDERGKRLFPTKTKKVFFSHLLQQKEIEDYATFGSFVDFGTSTPVVRAVAEHLGFIPVISRTMPQGIRLMESYAGYDDAPETELRESQNYHLDHHDTQLVYVILLLRDVTPECGPWTFLPASKSAEVVKALGYGKRGVPYRLTDEEVYAVVDKKHAIPLTYPAGTVLFIDSSKCFHYGSRNAVVPRYQLMFGYTSACRGDLTEAYMPIHRYGKPDPTTLERLVLEQEFMPAAIPSRRQLPEPAQVS